MSDDVTKEMAIQDKLGNGLVEVKDSHALQVKQAESLDLLAKSVNQIAQFLSEGGLTNLLSGYAKSQIAKEILGGLATHHGRDALDARLLNQNALESVVLIEKLFDKFQEKQVDKNKDPEIKDAEADYKNFCSKKDGV